MVETLRAGTADINTVWSVDSIRQAQTSKALLFESRQQHFAVAASYVREVVEAPRITPVPGAPWWYCGVAAYRSQPVPVIDPVQFFVPLQDNAASEHTRAVVVSLASSIYFLAVQKIVNLCQLDPAYNPLVNDDLSAHSAISSVCNIDSKSVALIDTPEFLRQVQLLRVCR